MSLIASTTSWLPTSLRKPVVFAFLGGIGAILGQVVAEPWQWLMTSERVGRFYVETFGGAGGVNVRAAEVLLYLTITPVWLAIVGAVLGISLVVGQDIYLGRGMSTFRQIALAIVGGAVSGFVAGVIAETIFQLAQAATRSAGLTATVHMAINEMCRVAVWAVFGTLAGLGLSLFVPNLRPSRGMVGGLVGGVLGGCIFVLISWTAGKLLGVSPLDAPTGDMDSYRRKAQWVNLISRFGGVWVIGASIGAMIALAELLLSSAVLDVIYGPKDIRVIPLSPKPVRVGGNRELCAVVVQGAPAELLRFRFEGGRVVVDDLSTGRTEAAGTNFQRTVGRVTLRVRGGSPAGIPAPQPGVPAPVSTPPAPAGGFQPPKPPAQPAANAIRLRRANGQVVSVQMGVPLKQGHIAPGGSNPAQPVAELVRNPNDPSVLGLKNLGQTDWQATLPDGRRTAIAPGRVVRATPGTTIDAVGLQFTVV